MMVDLFFLDEPLNLWLNNMDKNWENILNKFYNNQEKICFIFSGDVTHNKNAFSKTSIT